MNDKHEIQLILDSIRRIVQGIRISSRVSEKKIGLSSAQLFVLQKLSEAAPLTVNGLAERTMTHQSSVSVVVRRLEERKLVRRARSRTDGRKSELSLTERGQGLLAKAPASAQQRLVDALAAMPERERKTLNRLLRKLTRASGLVDGPAAMFFEEGA